VDSCEDAIALSASTELFSMAILCPALARFFIDRLCRENRSIASATDREARVLNADAISVAPPEVLMKVGFHPNSSIDFVSR